MRNTTAVTVITDMSNSRQRRHNNNNNIKNNNTSSSSTSVWWCRLLSLALIVLYACLLLGLQIAQHRQIHQLVAFSTIVEQEFLQQWNTSTSTSSRSSYIKPLRPVVRKDRRSSSSISISSHEDDIINTQQNPWLQDYVTWHRQQRALLNATNWNTFRYIVLQCTELDASCGSVMDLKSIPLFLLVGHLSQRILLIHWDYETTAVTATETTTSGAAGGNKGYENHQQQRKSTLSSSSSSSSQQPQQQQHDRRKRRRRLTDVLVPPLHGIDWRMPDYLIPEIGFEPRPMTSNKHVKQAVEGLDPALAEAAAREWQRKISWNVVYAFSSTPGAGGARLFQRIQTSSSSSVNTSTGGVSYEQFFRHAFFTLFTPTPRLARRVQETMVSSSSSSSSSTSSSSTSSSQSSLIPNQFVGVYIGETATGKAATSLVDHATRCASSYYHPPASSNAATQQHHDSIVFLAASDPNARKATTAMSSPLVKTSTTRQHNHVIINNNDKNDHDNNRSNRTSLPHEMDSYETTLVELLVMSQSQCVLHDQQDLGLLAAWMSLNVSCAMRLSFRHVNRDNYAACRRNGNDNTIAQQHQQHQPQKHLFPDPMPHDDTLNAATTSLKQSFRPFTTAWYLYSDVGDDDSLAPVSYAPPLAPLLLDNQEQQQQLQVQQHRQVVVADSTASTNLWESSTVLPKWMKDYFTWHQAQRAKINPTNWQQFKYIVMQCTNKDKRCGGTADRLKAVPMLLLVASLTQRIFFIHWELPKALEEFLVPPVGGMDWRLPPFLKTRLFPPMRALIDNDHRLKNAMADNEALYWNVKYQTYHSGMLFFNENKPPDTPTFDQVYHDAWKVLFTPAPPIARMVEDFMERAGLIPGEYAAAHIRAQYARVERPRLRTILLTRNALRCASMLFPGGPIFVASDDLNATEEALVYGVKRNSRIVARNETNTPLHLEKASNPELRQPSEYYDTFVDFYLMGMGRCVTFNKGGFGHWASLISYNSSCVFRHQFNERYTNCSWTIPSHDVSQRMTQKLQRPIFPAPMPNQDSS